MVDFRRWILALAVLALFAGTASAANAQLSCATNVSSVPQLRSEGITEQIGDITFTCTGGNPVGPGQPIPIVNISIFLNTNVTSRLVPTTNAANASEALLLIDEPGQPGTPVVPSFGIAAPQNLCTTPEKGCAEVAALAPTDPTITVAVDAPPADQTVAGRNVFQGIFNPDGNHNNLITFFGIPVLPPATTGFSRVFRITNIRANASIFNGLLANTQGNIVANIAVSNPSALPITNAQPSVGLVQSGLSASPAITTPATFSLCLGGTASGTVGTTLTYKERFGTAFKPRVDPLTNATFTNQNIPGAVYNSESGFILSGGPIGLADFGTRLKATFHGLPAGATLAVSLTNTDTAVGHATAVLVTGEAVGDGASNTAANATSGTIAVDATGNATAVWEVTAANPNTLDTLTFTATTTFPAATASVTAPVTVNMSFAPTNPPTALATVIPIFVDSSAANPTPILNVNVCRTILLYPFVTNSPGFDTGIAIANTSTDPFGTAPQTGTCTLNWFSSTTNPPPFTTPTPVASGTVFTTILSVNTSTAGIVGGFTGYMIASCNFQYAHGFAFISDLGTRQFAMGYLALVIPDPSANAPHGRVASPGAQGIPGSGESNSQ